MSALSRRGFARRLLMGAVVPFFQRRASVAQSPLPPPPPEVIAGYRLTEEEQSLAAKFLANHEQAMQPLRSVDLPNSLSPAMSFKARRFGGSKERP